MKNKIILKFFCSATVALFSSISLGLSNSEAAIEKEFEAVVFLRVDDIDKNGEQGPAFCNGTLIADNVIVTAAHCVRGNEVLGQYQVDVEVGSYKFRTGSDGQERRIGYVPYLRQTTKAQYYYTKAVTQNIKNLHRDVDPAQDIAVILLKENLPLKENFSFATVITQTELGGLRGNVTSYWPTIVSNNIFEEIATTDTKRKGQLNQISWGGRGYLESKSSVRVAPGDSGAPLFFRLGPQWRLGGIVKGRAETFFSNWDVVGTLDNKICEISGQIPQIDIQKLLCKP